MEIDLKKRGEFTIDSLKELMNSVDDTYNTQYRITKDGFLILSKDVGNRNLEGIVFRLETNIAYNNYAGPEA